MYMYTCTCTVPLSYKLPITLVISAPPEFHTGAKVHECTTKRDKPIQITDVHDKYTIQALVQLE